MTTTAQKPFFHLGNKTIEYSTDFDFFLKNQIFTVTNNSAYPTINFYSSLESKWLGRLKNITSISTPFTQEQVQAKCKEIHQNLMAGKHGEPTFVD